MAGKVYLWLSSVREEHITRDGIIADTSIINVLYFHAYVSAGHFSVHHLKNIHGQI